MWGGKKREFRICILVERDLNYNDITRSPLSVDPVLIPRAWCRLGVTEREPSHCDFLGFIRICRCRSLSDIWIVASIFVLNPRQFPVFLKPFTLYARLVSPVIVCAAEKLAVPSKSPVDSSILSVIVLVGWWRRSFVDREMPVPSVLFHGFINYLSTVSAQTVIIIPVTLQNTYTLKSTGERAKSVHITIIYLYI